MSDVNENVRLARYLKQ